MFIDSNCLNDLFRFRPGEVDGQQPVLQIRTQHMHPFCQHEGALEVARGNAAMDVLPGLVVLLAAADDELIFLNGHIELVAGKPATASVIRSRSGWPLDRSNRSML